MTGAKGAADAEGWTANVCWVSMGTAGTVKAAWEATGAAAAALGAGTIPGGGNTGRE